MFVIMRKRLQWPHARNDENNNDANNGVWSDVRLARPADTGQERSALHQPFAIHCCSP